jgi:hypothetical protein
MTDRPDLQKIHRRHLERREGVMSDMRCSCERGLAVSFVSTAGYAQAQRCS